ncbi:MAG: riboflavin synthase [Acetobacter sp.]|nr:riboflavin synthase [Acetobacter sp.]
MFSGIIETMGQIIRLERSTHSLTLEVQTGFYDVCEGESIALNGVCLTAITPTTQGVVRFFVSSETLARTSLNQLEVSKRVNLERAVTPSTRLSGHIVQGHVDGVAQFVACVEIGEAKKVTFAVPRHLRRYMVEKGSIALEGISLTINDITDESTCEISSENNNQKNDDIYITLMIIPHTWEQTTLGELRLGDRVNIEVDVIAKYVEVQCQYK